MAQSDLRLLLLACSQRKRPDGGFLPALERYDGPAYRLVRRFLHAYSCAPVSIFLLSAEFGLIPHDCAIPAYDRRMTAERAQELQPSAAHRLWEIERRYAASDVFVHAGRSYLAALAGWLECRRSSRHVQIASGPPGRRLAQLHEWLYAPAGATPESSTTARI